MGPKLRRLCAFLVRSHSNILLVFASNIKMFSYYLIIKKATLDEIKVCLFVSGFVMMKTQKG